MGLLIRRVFQHRVRFGRSQDHLTFQLIVVVVIGSWVGWFSRGCLVRAAELHAIPSIVKGRRRHRRRTRRFLGFRSSAYVEFLARHRRRMNGGSQAPLGHLAGRHGREAGFGRYGTSPRPRETDRAHGSTNCGGISQMIEMSLDWTRIIPPIPRTDIARMTDHSPEQIFQAPFRPRARMLRLLGDELIGSPRLAVFELVKNAYDADATEVRVCLEIASDGKSRITVSDDGEGMSMDTLKSVWLVPGHDQRQKQRREGRRSPKHNRLPLGEKGVGRFAVHKLGDRIKLTTRSRGSDECVVEIDWNELTSKRFLDEALVRISTRSPQVFDKDRTGTRIEIRQLRPPEWTRGEVRRLCNQITSICSPFEEPSSFRATLAVPGHETWIEGLPDFAEIVDRAFWRFRFSLRDGRFDCEYTFRQVPGFNLEGREVSKTGDVLKLPRSGSRRKMAGVVANSETTQGIGPITGEFFVYDRDREVLRRLGDTRLLTRYLDEHGGVRVYRDGIRIYNYGEKGDDWLGLDLRRVNIPTRRISRNIILGAVVQRQSR